MANSYTTRLNPGQVTQETQWIANVNKTINEASIKRDQNQQLIQESKKVFEGNVTDKNLHIIAICHTSLDELVATNFDYIPPELRDNFSIIHVALTKLDFDLFGKFIDKFISPEKLSDANFMLTMVKSHGIKMLNFADPSLVNSPEFMFLARDIERSSKTNYSKQVRGRGRENIKQGIIRSNQI